MEFSEFIIMGDFNVHAEDYQNSDNIAFTDLANSFAMCQHVHTQTHVADDTLDQIFTMAATNLQLIELVGAYYISDHTFVQCTVKKLETRK